MPQFTPHQDAALKAVADWLKAKPGTKDTPPVFRLFGYAGTGKTTLARHIADGVDGEVKYAAFTGKAASVMRGKGCHGASTIHSLIYRTRESEIAGVSAWPLISRNTGYRGRPPLSRVDDEFRGLGPLYRLYRAADGWVFLAAPAEGEWPALAAALSLDDVRFATAAGRAANADALAEALTEIFAPRPRDDWEA